MHCKSLWIKASAKCVNVNKILLEDKANECKACVKTQHTFKLNLHKMHWDANKRHQTTLSRLQSADTCINLNGSVVDLSCCTACWKYQFDVKHTHQPAFRDLVIYKLNTGATQTYSLKVERGDCQTKNKSLSFLTFPPLVFFKRLRGVRPLSLWSLSRDRDP